MNLKSVVYTSDFQPVCRERSSGAAAGGAGALLSTPPETRRAARLYVFFGGGGPLLAVPHGVSGGGAFFLLDRGAVSVAGAEGDRVRRSAAAQLRCPLGEPSVRAGGGGIAKAHDGWVGCPTPSGPSGSGLVFVGICVHHLGRKRLGLQQPLSNPSANHQAPLLLRSCGPVKSRSGLVSAFRVVRASLGTIRVQHQIAAASQERPSCLLVNNRLKEQEEPDGAPVPQRSEDMRPSVQGVLPQGAGSERTVS
ncbi:unnamed protein product [Pleuronectes platessa]|uniref:Uncharacterized protein n=1 Tax=Pleuronectes platessa TaxID=8262 RepID=A0A9N7V0I5_PLEPL|nr:unnamed protein product [Pleuronectes platessa]